MTTITTRAGKGSPLTNNEVDANFTNLSNDNQPTIRPSLLLDFANSKTLDPRITFTRGSTATYWDGHTTTKAEENLITYSAGNGNITAQSITFTQNDATAPDGTTTATKVTYAGHTGGYLYKLFGLLEAGTAYTWSTYVKYGNVDNIIVGFVVQNVLAAGATFTFSTQAFSGVAAGVSTSYTDVGNGWYRVALTYTPPAPGSTSNFMKIAAATTAWTTGSYAYTWGAQLEQRSSATAYTPTTTTPVVKYQPTLQTASSGEARFDHDPVTGESKGLLIEEARTNNLTYSEQLDNAAWTKSGSYVTANTMIAPDGTQTADKLSENTANSSHDIRQTFTGSTSTTYTYSFYAKAGERSEITFFGALSSGSVGGSFNLATGVATSSYMYPVGNGWYRCWIPVTTASSGGALNMIIILNNGSSASYAGDGYSGLYLWGFQLEVGSFPTSYIPTSGSTVTRALETCTFLDLSQIPYNQGNGTTMLVEAQTPDTTTLRGLMNFSRGNENDFYGISVSGGDITGRIRANSTYEVINTTVTGLSAGAYSTTAMSVHFNNPKSAQTATNGTVSTADTSFSQTVPEQITRLAIGTIASSSYVMNGCVKKAALYPKAFNSATLQAMTEE